MDLANYKDQFRDWFSSFFAKSAQPITTHRCCISIAANQLCLVHANYENEETEILLSECRPYKSFDDLSTVLSTLVKKHNLETLPTYWLLSPEDYQLFLIESMPVSEAEFYDALHWRIRSLINYPIEEAVLDYFNLPAKKSSSNSPMIAAVVAKKSQLAQMIQLIQKFELVLTKISVPEIALKNLAALQENDERSTALIAFYEKKAVLNISRNKLLYFTRHIALSNNQKQRFEQISLEILRYFDYFQSQWRNPSPTRVYVCVKTGDVTEIVQSLTNHLSLNVEPFSLQQIDTVKPLSLSDNQCVLEVGCTLPDQDVNNAPNS